MRLGVMQPYFLPYIGYYQLMTSVDLFIYYDDVTYIKQGWINRNNILLNNKDYRFALELSGASSFKKINEITIGGNRGKLLKTFTQAYSKHPYFKDVNPLLHDIFDSADANLFEYIYQTNRKIFDYLKLNVNCIVSSEIEKNNNLQGQAKILDICKRLGAKTYFNAIGGQHLYSRQDFKNEGLELYFISTPESLPRRSIIDVLMNHSPKEIKEMLKNYTLV